MTSDPRLATPTNANSMIVQQVANELHMLCQLMNKYGDNFPFLGSCPNLESTHPGCRTKTKLRFRVQRVANGTQEGFQIQAFLKDEGSEGKIIIPPTGTTLPKLKVD